MSNTEDFIDTGRTTVFYDGMQAGIEKERERVIELLQKQISDCGEACDYCVAQEDAIALINGEEH